MYIDKRGTRVSSEKDELKVKEKEKNKGEEDTRNKIIQYKIMFEK